MATSLGARGTPLRQGLALVALLLSACESGLTTPGGGVVTTVALNPTVFGIAVGEVIRLDVVPRNREGWEIVGGPVTWSSSAPEVANVDSLGLVRGRSEGSAQVSAVVSGITGTARVTVTSAAVSEWREHSCAVASDGTVWCWGRGGNGELGAGTRLSSSTPVRAAIEEPAAAVSVGASHSCALGSSGRLQCWGRGAEGQLGDGTTRTRATPAPVGSDEHYRSVSAGGRHSCGITTAGQTRCWGWAFYGQIGNDAMVDVSTPVELVGGISFTRVSAGARHTCGLTSEGRAYCWGDNRHGQLGDGTTVQRSSPVAVLTDLRFGALSAGARHNCALTSEGLAWCWGDNGQGQLGNGSLTSSPVPQDVHSTPDFRLVSVAAGGSHSCGVRPDGIVFCWGAGQFGQLGSGGRTLVGNPTEVGVALFREVVAGNAHSCGVTLSPAALCWGLNVFGQLGTGDYEDRIIPSPVIGGIPFTSSTG